MNDFEYLAPKDLQAAQNAMKACPDAKWLAGGMSLLSAMKLRLNQPPLLIDLRQVEALHGIRREADNLVVGAMTRHADVAASGLVRAEIPALADLAAGIGDRQVRNRGTIGGSIANSDPAACYPAGVLALGAIITTNIRRIACDSFFVSLFETALQPDELILEVSFPIPRRAAYVKFAQPASRFALVGVMACESRGGAVRVGVTGARAHAYRETFIERALMQKLTPDQVRAVSLPGGDYNSDMHADAEYRRHLVSEIAARAIAKMIEAPPLPQ